MALDKATTALLVIDAIDPVGVDSLHKDRVYDPQDANEAYRLNVGKVVDMAHEAGLPVIFSNDQHVPAYDNELKLWGEHGIKDKMVIIPECNVLDKDIVIPKRRYDGFFQTDLDLTLRELGVDTIIAVGADSNICVLHTLAGAYYRNYKIIVVEDATYTFLCGTQEAAVEHYVKCYDAQLVKVDELKDMLA